MATPPGVHFMKGGFQEQVTDLFSKYEQPLAALLVGGLVLATVFLEQIPISVRRQADTVLGRLTLLLFTAIITIAFGWPLGMIAALMVASLIASGAATGSTGPVTEGFSPDFSVRLVPKKHKWFVERVLGENQR